MKTQSIKGKFSVKSTPLESDEVTQAVGATRMKFEKSFEGALQGQGIVTMTAIFDKSAGAGAYVALERITGSLDGKSGSFGLQHSCSMEGSQQLQSISVIPGSGTGELAGLKGQMKIEIAKDGQHFYIFEYEL